MTDPRAEESAKQRDRHLRLAKVRYEKARGSAHELLFRLLGNELDDEEAKARLDCLLEGLVDGIAMAAEARIRIKLCQPELNGGDPLNAALTLASAAFGAVNGLALEIARHRVLAPDVISKALGQATELGRRNLLRGYGVTLRTDGEGLFDPFDPSRSPSEEAGP